MTKKDILTFRQKLTDFLDSNRLFDAFSLARAVSEKNLTWELTDRIDSLEKSYSYMISYSLRGVEDPQRQRLYDEMVESLRVIADMLCRKAETAEAPELYYNTVRYYDKTRPQSTIADMVRQYDSLASANDLFSSAISDNASPKDDTNVAAETLERELFQRIWVSFPLGEADYEALSEAIGSQSLEPRFKQLIVSALMMAMMQFYDERKLLLIMQAYRSDNVRLSTTALVALILSLYANRHRSLSPKAAAMLKIVRDLPGWRADIKSAFIELVRTHDTDRITDKMRNEIVPEMLKMRSQINPEELKTLDPAALEENPEWQERLEMSGIGEKLREMHELQEEGSDIFMASFAHLKSYPFFSHIANWFLPFSADHSEVKKLGDFAVMGNLLEASPYLCDSDKFSFVLSIANIPAEQRESLSRQMKAQNEAMAEMAGASLSLVPAERGRLINKYVQNLYRFFQLFRRKGDFVNPFRSEINLTEIPSLEGDFMDDDTLLLVAEFYFRHHYYREAKSVFLLWASAHKAEAEIYQKLGYCEQNLGHIEQALDYYEKAEILRPGSAWTLRRMAACSMQLKRYDRALQLYLQLDGMKPDDFHIICRVGDCYLKLGDCKSALKYYYKALYLNDQSLALRRAMSWALMLDGRLDKALEMQLRIMSEDYTGEDCLNHGHLLVLSGDYSTAVARYREVLRTEGWDRERFIAQMYRDFEELRPELISDRTIALIIDATSYPNN